MKTIYFFILISVLCFQKSFSQPPQAIPYQAIVRNNSGNVMSNQSISLRFSIHDSIATGSIVYQEKQNGTTNQFGSVSVNIGNGVALSGIFEDILWEKNDKFLQVELDVSGGASFSDLGTSQMLSVPYALYSKHARYTDSANFSGVLYDTTIMIINTENASSHDTVFRVDKKGVSIHKGREIFFRGLIIQNDTLIVTDSLGNRVFVVNPDGTSYHKGLEKFEGGIVIGDPLKAHMFIAPDGSMQIVDSAGNVLFEVAPNGDSYHAGIETFASGTYFGDPNGAHVLINPDGSIQCVDTAGNVVFNVEPDGTSYHAGKETFAAGAVFGDPNEGHVTISPLGVFRIYDENGNVRVRIDASGAISLRDSDGKLLFGVDESGRSYHTGFETFYDGFTVGLFGKSHFTVNPDGSIEITDSLGNTMFSVSADGTSFHAGHETFAGGVTIGNPFAASFRVDSNGIRLNDPAGNMVFKVNPDGTSIHKGEESFEGGIKVGALGNFKIDPDGRIDLKNALGQTTFTMLPDGTSYHEGRETFRNGIYVGNPSGAGLEVAADGTISLYGTGILPKFVVRPDGTSEHLGEETFHGGAVFGTPYTNLRIGDHGEMEYKNGNETLFSIDQSGNSYHKGMETYEGGITIVGDDGNKFTIEPNGFVHLNDANGNVLFSLSPWDGSSYHAGHETYDGGITVNNSNLNVTGSGIFSGNGAGIYSLNASNLSTGTVNDALLSPNVVRTNNANVFNETQTTMPSAPGSDAVVGVAPGQSPGASSGKAGKFYGDGEFTGTLTAGSLNSGSLSGNGAGIYNMNADNLSHGIVSDARLSPNLVRTNTTNIFSQTQTTMPATFGSDAVVGVAPGFSPGPSSGKAGMFYGDGQFTGSITASAFIIDGGGPITLIGNGSQITDLNASALATGMVDDNRLSPNVLRGNFPNVFTETQTMNAITPGNDALVAVAPGQVPGPFSNKAGMFYGDGAFTGLLSAGSYIGNGSGITNLHANSVATGTLSDLRLSPNIPKKNALNIFSQPMVITSNSLGSALQSSNSGGGPAGIFNGDVQVNGTLTKAAGTFKIDHPLDPENKYLYHSFVESPDMMNIYNGNITLDNGGKATVQLPEWFNALNKDFRYQLTPIGSAGPDLYIEEEIINNNFKIAGGKAGMKVSWMVTGVRDDAFAKKHPIEVEVDKPLEVRGGYLHPEAFGK